MLRAKQRLLMVVPLTLLIITLIIYLNTRSMLKTAIVLLAVPFLARRRVAGPAVSAGYYNLSVAVWVGIIALAGLDAETGVIMLLYLDLAYDEWKQKGLMSKLGPILRDANLSRRGETAASKVMTACGHSSPASRRFCGATAPGAGRDETQSPPRWLAA